ncbi:MAG: hypothetical protein UHB38_06285, partial [Anaerovibrio sp.]|uniref:hypothetical protein n=1 Tax=Anaerovibrio sp. TaxID=1872532 RepID=UPI002E7832C0
MNGLLCSRKSSSRRLTASWNGNLHWDIANVKKSYSVIGNAPFQGQDLPPAVLVHLLLMILCMILAEKATKKSTLFVFEQGAFLWLFCFAWFIYPASVPGSG